MPLSEFFYAEHGKGVNLGTLDGKARLAERCKPMLAQIPDGAFGDLMRQRLVELTGVGARLSTPETHVPVQRARNAPATHAPRQSLVRSAIIRLLHQPALALSLRSPYRFAMLRQPGVELLADMVALVHGRPEISTGALLEHFSDRDEAVALQKLASQTLPGEEALWCNEFADVMAQLEKLTEQQRIDELQAKHRDGGLDDADKGELRALLQSRFA